MLASVAVCYALVLQTLLGTLAMASTASANSNGYFNVICFSSENAHHAPVDGGKPIKATHYCVLCQSGVGHASVIDIVPSVLPLDRRSAIVSYSRRQDPATAPLYLPPRNSRGPPFPA